MTTQDTTSKREVNLPLLLGGGVALLALLALIFFGGNLLGDGETAVSPDNDAASGATVSLPTGGEPLQAGDRPYAFTLTTLNGEAVSLSEHIGKPIIVNFWATWCGPCRIEMPEFQDVYREHREQDLTILAVNFRESPAQVERFFVDEFGFSYTPLLDEEGDVAARYGVGRSLPTTYFIDPGGEITTVHRGVLTRGQIDTFLADILPSEG
jgi:thiol-disulfide isomerase/thioredoxin